jgi:hypothetical protein
MPLHLDRIFRHDLLGIGADAGGAASGHENDPRPLRLVSPHFIEKCNLPDAIIADTASARKRHRLNYHNRMVFRRETERVESNGT